MAYKKKYLTSQVINLLPFSRDLTTTDKEKEKFYNDALIKLRAAFRKVSDNDKKAAFKMMHFNKMVKSKYQDEITNVIKMYLREDKFDLKDSNTKTDNSLLKIIKRK